LRAVTLLAVPYSFLTHYTPTHLRCDALLFGVGLSYWYHFSRKRFESFVRRHRIKLLAFSIAAISPALILPVERPFIYTVGFLLLNCGFGSILACAVVHEPAILQAPQWISPATSAIVLIGRNSYSIYLWHILVAKALVATLRVVSRHSHHIPYFCECVVYLLLAIIVGVVMAKCIEFPVLRLRDRLFPSRVTEVDEVAVAISASAEPALQRTNLYGIGGGYEAGHEFGAAT
jgi:peptidoglycan/LPS O-acetylase OafA/YrhL